MAAEKTKKANRSAGVPDAAPGPRRIADEPVAEAGAHNARVRSPVTPAGQPIEQQVRKQWDPKKKGGLPTLLRQPRP